MSACATITNCLEILGNTPNLVDFRAQCGFVDAAVRLPDPVYHHSLQTLHIGAPEMDDRRQRLRGKLQVLFERLTLPTLKDLDNCSFSGFLRRTGGGLLKVSIKGELIAFEDIINYLYLTLLATDVDIKADTIYDEAFYKFETEGTMSTRKVLVPRLQHLQITGDMYLTQRAFLEFLKAR